MSVDFQEIGTEMVTVATNEADLSNTAVQQNQNDDNQEIRCPIDLSRLMESFLDYMPESEAQRKSIYTIFTILVVSAVIIISLNNSNCSQVTVTNKTSDTLFPEYSAPFGTKVKPRTFWLPYQDLAITFTAGHTYADVGFYGDMTFHFAHYGKTSKLKNGPEGYVLKAYPKGFLTQCRFKYEKSNSPAVEYYTAPSEDTYHLRGSKMRLAQSPHTLFGSINSEQGKPVAENQLSLTV